MKNNSMPQFKKRYSICINLDEDLRNRVWELGEKNITQTEIVRKGVEIYENMHKMQSVKK